MTLCAAAQEPVKPSSSQALVSPAADSQTAWSGPDTSDGFDWLELTSGEWLKGEFKALYDDTLEFDSDKLGLLELDWKDVRRVVNGRPHMVRSQDRQEFSGSVYIDENRVQVVGGNGATNVFARADLLSVVEGSPQEINYWSFKIGAGLTVQKGNSDQADLNVSARVQRRTAANRFNFEYLGLASYLDGAETANNSRVNSSFDVFVSRKCFVRPVFGEYYRDRFQNLEHRATVGGGVGYHVLDTSRTEWDVYGGPAYQYTKFTSVLPGESTEEHTPAFVAGTVYDTEFTKWMDFDLGYQMTLLNRDSGTYTHHATAGVEIELTQILDLDLSVVWDRTENPRGREDGSVPEQDDFRFIAGVSLDF
jgi:putative salt-induced outer membrane protein YdiY